MISNNKDWYTLLTVICIVLLRVIVWLFASGQHSYLIVPIAALVFVLYSIKHNQLHHKIFRLKWQNRIFEHLLDIFTGNTFSSIQIVHLANHHKEANNAEDWGHTKPFERTHPLVGLMKYILVTPYRYIQGKRQWIRSRASKNKRKQIIWDSIVLYGATLLMLVVHPWNTVLFILLPNILAQFVLVGFNYLQHSGCDSASAYNHSRNFTGAWLNVITFNNGYHTAHHLKPHLHWSEYPAFHASIERHIDPKLNINNLLIFLWNMHTETKSVAR